MKRVVAALVMLTVLVAVGCNKNDENTINSLPKSHLAFPAFHLQVDNRYQTFGIDSVLLTVSPSVGWDGPVYSNGDGYIGALPAGTYITSIDTIVKDNDTIIDTTAIIHGFTPGQAYTFTFERNKAFEWADAFKAVFANTVDSSWARLAIDTEKVCKLLDPDRPPQLATDSTAIITNPDDTVGNSPLQVLRQPILYGFWFDSAFVIPGFDTASTAGYPPDSLKIDTLLWGYWMHVDTFYLSGDTASWCDSVGTDTTVRIVQDYYNQPLYLRTVTIKYSCSSDDTEKVNPANVRNRIYRTFGWTDFDTNKHFSFPDTTKGLIFTPSGISIYTWRVTGSDTISDTMPVQVYLIDGLAGDTTMINTLQFQAIMPKSEEYKFPDYKLLIRSR